MQEFMFYWLPISAGFDTVFSFSQLIQWSRDLFFFKEQTMGCPIIMGSNTHETLAMELKGRDIIVVHRDDDPKTILGRINKSRCFVIGGGRTNSRFSSFLTHLYITPHPLVFGKGVPSSVFCFH